MSKRLTHLVAGFALFALPFVCVRVEAQTTGTPDRDPNTAQQMQAGDNAQMDAQARAHFRVGQSLYDSGRFQESAVEFAAAYDLSHRPQLLFNVYVGYRDAGDTAHAVEALRGYLAAMPGDLEGRLNLEARLRSLEASLAQQTAATPATPVETTTPAVTTPAVSTPPPVVHRESHRSSVGLVIGGVGAAMVLTGVVTGVLAMGKVSDLETMCPNGACPASAQSTRDSASTLVTVTDIMFFGGGALVVGGLAYWLFGPRVEEVDTSVQASAFCASSTCMAYVNGQF